MRAVQTVYCTLPFFEDICAKRKDSPAHKVASRVIENLSNIYLDISQEEFQRRVKGNAYYNKLFKRENKTFRSKPYWKDIILLDSITDEVCFVHPEYMPNFKDLRDQKGALIISSDSDINLLTRMNDKRGYVCIVPEEDRIGQLDSGYQNSWEECISTCNLKPINSLIISDNYLFSKFGTRKYSGLLALLKSVIPTNLNVPFHLAIFSLVGNNYTFPKDNAEDLITEIKSLFPNVDMKITIIIHTKKSTTHDREILSNYHRVTSGAGYSVIEDEEGIKEVAKGFIEPVFHSILTTPENDMCVKHFHFQTLEWLKPIYHREQGAGAGSYIVGDREHRLLDK
jgi:hypothetical protein